MDRCPAWTDHNVSDPGVTLIETFAYMTDQLLYRLNRVPDRLYIKFLELIGIRLFPPTAARDRRDVLAVGAGDDDARHPRRHAHGDAARRRRRAGRLLARCAISRSCRPSCDASPRAPTTPTACVRGSEAARGRHRGSRRSARCRRRATCCSIGLDRAAPGNAVAFHVRLRDRRRRRRPDRPAARVGGVERRSSGSSANSRRTRPAASTARATSSSTCPPGTRESLIEGERAGMGAGAGDRGPRGPAALQLVAADPRPRRASTVGGTADSAHAEDRRAGARRRVERTAGPALPARQRRARRHRSDADHRGQLRRGLGGVGAGRLVRRLRSGRQGRDPRCRRGRDRVRAARAARGRVDPCVRRDPAGSARRSASATTPSAAAAAATSPARSIRTLKSSIPFVRGVTNRHPASGGVDAESVDEARVRGPLMLRTRSRAVTAEDFELLTREAAPEVARVRCIPGPDRRGRRARDRVHRSRRRRARTTSCASRICCRPRPTLAAIAERLEDCADHRLGRARRAADLSGRHRRGPSAQHAARRCRARAQRRRRRAPPLLRPARRRAERQGLAVGPPGAGGRRVQRAAAGRQASTSSRTSGCSAPTRSRASAAKRPTRLELAANSLVFSYEHQVRVVTP